MLVWSIGIADCAQTSRVPQPRRTSQQRIILTEQVNVSLKHRYRGLCASANIHLAAFRCRYCLRKSRRDVIPVLNVHGDYIWMFCQNLFIGMRGKSFRSHRWKCGGWPKNWFTVISHPSICIRKISVISVYHLRCSVIRDKEVTTTKYVMSCYWKRGILQYALRSEGRSANQKATFMCEVI